MQEKQNVLSICIVKTFGAFCLSVRMIMQEMIMMRHYSLETKTICL